MTDYPEHEKLQKVKGYTQAIGEFLDWLGERGIYLAEWERNSERMFPIGGKRNIDLIAEFYDLDRDALEEEKRVMLRTVREAAELNSVESLEDSRTAGSND